MLKHACAKFLFLFIQSPCRPLAPLQVPYYSEALLATVHRGYCIEVSRRSAQATAGKGLAQGPYVAARAGVEPTTLRLKVIVSTTVEELDGGSTSYLSYTLILARVF